MSGDEKLHVDEGWKAQVEREKELLKEKATGTQSSSGVDSPSSEPAGLDSGHVTSGGETHHEPLRKEQEQQSPPPPPASFQFLIASLATQAMACLGQIPDDDGKPLPVNLPYAKHFIDLLGVIEDKTHNNLDEGEAAYIKGALHQLRIQFVESSRS